jgi:hypothetical protein
MVRTIVAKKNAAGAYFSLPAPTANGKLNMKTDSGAEPVMQRKSTSRSPTEPDRSFSTLSRHRDVNRGDGSLMSQMGMDNSPSLRARHRASGFEFCRLRAANR